MKIEEIVFCWSEQKSKPPFGSLSTQGNLNILTWFSIAASICSLILWVPFTAHAFLFRWKICWNSKMTVNKSRLWEVNCTFDTELRLSWTKIFCILGCFYLPCSFTQSSSFMTFVYHCGRRAWILKLVVHDSWVCSTYWGMTPFCSPILKAEWEILRVDSLNVGEKIHPCLLK